MTLKDKITKDLVAAMKSKDQASVRGIRAIKAAILLLETDGSGEEITPEKEIKLLQKLIKQRQDSLTIFQEQNRQDLATIEEEEVAVIQRYLPEPLDEEELESMIRSVISESGATSMKDMGRVMGLIGSRVAGRADNKMVAEKVKSILTQS